MQNRELIKECEASKKDVLEGCQSVNIHYYSDHQEWMNDYHIQAVFQIIIRPKPTTTTGGRMITSDSNIIYVGCHMPHGYIRLSSTISAANCSSDIGDDSNVVSGKIFDAGKLLISSECYYYPSLNSLLMDISLDYMYHKEQELSGKLEILRKSQSEQSSNNEEEDDDWN